MEANDFLKQFYNEEIVDAAHACVSQQLENNINVSNLLLDKLIDKYEDNDEETTRLLHSIKDDIKNGMYHEMMFSYIYGTEYAIKNENILTDKIKNYLKSDYCKNKDFSVIIDFDDNDFSLYMEQVAQEYCDEYNHILWKIDKYDDCEFMKESYIKDLEYLENPENLRNIISSLFMGVYMSNTCDRVRWKNKNNSLSFKEYMTNAVKVTDYLDLTNEKKYYIGKIDDISKDIMEKYKDCQDSEIIKENNIEKYWFNSQVLIIKIKNGRLAWNVQ